MGFFLRTILLSFVAGLLLTFALSAQLKQVVAPTSPILGFSPAHATAEHQLETAFQSIPSPEKTRDWHHTFTAEPHPAASERNNQLADFIAAEWRKQGWEDVALRRYDVLHSRPRSVSLEMIAPIAFTASLREDAYDADPDTKNSAVSSSYFGYSASGDVTAEVVYAHSGNPEDYDLLRKNGISVKGKIVLVRYSNPYSYRGFKALTPLCSSIPIPPKTVSHAAKFFPMAPGARRVTSSAAQLPTITSFPAIPLHPAGPPYRAQSTSRRKRRVRCPKFLLSRFPGATLSRLSKT